MSAFVRTERQTGASAPEVPSYSDMVRVLGGTFRMGSDRHYPEEAPVHRVTVSPFWIDLTPVTNCLSASLSRRRAISRSPRLRPTRRIIQAHCRTC